MEQLDGTDWLGAESFASFSLAGFLWLYQQFSSQILRSVLNFLDTMDIKFAIRILIKIFSLGYKTNFPWRNWRLS